MYRSMFTGSQKQFKTCPRLFSHERRQFHRSLLLFICATGSGVLFVCHRLFSKTRPKDNQPRIVGLIYVILGQRCVRNSSHANMCLSFSRACFGVLKRSCWSSINKDVSFWNMVVSKSWYAGMQIRVRWFTHGQVSRVSFAGPTAETVSSRASNTP